MLRQIFEWAQVGHESKALKVRHPKTDARGGVYLQFRPNDDEAWLGIGPDSPKTKFDVLPAYANPDKLDPSKARYAFLYRGSNTLGKGKWIIWRWREERAELSESITDNGMVRLERFPNNDGLKIVLTREATSEEREKKKQSTVLEELVMSDSMISEDDIKRARNKGETAQVQDFLSFVPFKGNKKIEVRPCFRVL